MLLDYVTAVSLVHPRDHKFIQLDSVLQESLLKKGEILDIMTKDEAVKRLRDDCQKWFSVE